MHGSRGCQLCNHHLPNWCDSRGSILSRIFVVFINALLEDLTCTGRALGISHGRLETKQFNNVAFMDDITTLAQDNTGAQILLNATQEFEAWISMRLNLSKTRCY